ncbi:MAG: hypothetical protein EOP85_09390 [Verrucomicrobiaceae bacterium]|nr:MAG: hypothetical protein EOP85_09390 [Verrucomicrobiaceae bacterium]
MNLSSRSSPRHHPLSDRWWARVLLAIACAAVAMGASPLLLGHGACHDGVEVMDGKLKKHPDDASLHHELAEAHAGHGE